ncbi:MAEBL [candidate division SR1 bacterium RAAC1_SR1_1]|nr:MAEBL [candidate division SR1 bacterium RAAC1_SR1_1]
MGGNTAETATPKFELKQEELKQENFGNTLQKINEHLQNKDNADTLSHILDDAFNKALTDFGKDNKDKLNSLNTVVTSALTGFTGELTEEQKQDKQTLENLQALLKPFVTQNTEKPVENKFETCTVKPGDTLSKIAKEKGITLAQIQDLNFDLFKEGKDSKGKLRKQDGGLIYPGDVIKIKEEKNTPQPITPEVVTPEVITPKTTEDVTKRDDIKVTEDVTKRDDIKVTEDVTKRDDIKVTEDVTKRDDIKVTEDVEPRVETDKVNESLNTELIKNLENELKNFGYDIKYNKDGEIVFSTKKINSGNINAISSDMSTAKNKALINFTDNIINIKYPKEKWNSFDKQTRIDIRNNVDYLINPGKGSFFKTGENFRYVIENGRVNTKLFTKLDDYEKKNNIV